METEYLRLLFYVLIGGTGLIITVVATVWAAYRFIQKLIDEKMTKHYLHEHVMEKDKGPTVRDRLVECRRVCPVTNPPTGGRRKL